MGCLRAVRGNGAALLFVRLVIDADPEAAMNRINLSRGRKRVSPDDILEQPDFACATLDRAGDPIGRLVVAMGIVSPGYKEGSGSDFPRTIGEEADRALGLFAFMGNEAIGEAEEEHLFRVQPELRPRFFCLLLAESRQTVRRIGLAVGMRAGAVTDNDDLSSQSPSARSAIGPPQARLSSSGCGAMTINGRASSISRNGQNGNEWVALRISPAIIATLDLEERLSI
jgi:hypothetical protein